MAIDPEKQTRYWRDRSPYPRPFAGETNDGLDEDNTKKSNNSSYYEAQKVKTFVRGAQTQTQRCHRVTGWAPSSTQEHDLERPLKRSITWGHEYAPWNPDRPRASQGSTRTSVSLNTSPSDDFYWLSMSEGSNPDELLDPRSPRFDNVQPKPTAADHPHPSLDNAEDDSARTCFSLVDSHRGSHLGTKTSRDREPLNIEYLLGPRRSRVLPSPFPGPPVRWLADVTAAATPPHKPGYESAQGSGQGSGDRKHDDENSVAFESRWGHPVDRGPWQRSDSDKPRGASLDADIEPLMEVVEKRSEEKDRLAVWLVFGLVGVWVLLMVANLKLAGWEAKLESMH